MLVGLLIALGGWSLSRTFELSTFQAVHNNQIDKLERKVEKLQIQQESGMHNKVNIEFLTKQLEKALEDIEKLKDKARDQHYKNGNGG